MNFKEIFRSINDLPNKCYLCGEHETKLEQDHLPPKCIFPREYWSLLIQVPICKRCHDKRNKDDEYFRDYLSIWCGKNVPKEIHQKRQKSWEERVSHKIATLKNLIPVWVELRSGLTIPGYALKGEMNRINPVLECIARGHYFSYKEVTIPESKIRILLTKAPFIDGSNDSSVRFLSKLPVLQEVVPGMFKFKSNNFREGETNISNWLLEFYDTIQFFIQFSWIEKRINSYTATFPKVDIS